MAQGLRALTALAQDRSEEIQARFSPLSSDQRIWRLTGTISPSNTGDGPPGLFEVMPS